MGEVRKWVLGVEVHGTIIEQVFDDRKITDG